MDPGDVQERVRGGCFGASRGETGQEMGTGVDVEFQGEIARWLLQESRGIYNAAPSPHTPPYMFWSPLLPPFS